MERVLCGAVVLAGGPTGAQAPLVLEVMVRWAWL